jgi:hypothetical protein
MNIFNSSKKEKEKEKDIAILSPGVTESDL